MDVDQWSNKIQSVFSDCSLYESGGDTLAHISSDSIYEISQELHSLSESICKHTELFEIEPYKDGSVVFQLVYKDKPQPFVNEQYIRELIIDEVSVNTDDAELINVDIVGEERAELTFKTEILDNSFSFSSLFTDTETPIYISNILAISQGIDHTEYTVELRANEHDEHTIDVVREKIMKRTKQFDCPNCVSRNSVQWELHEFNNQVGNFPDFVDTFVCQSCISMFVPKEKFEITEEFRGEPYSKIENVFEEHFQEAVENDYCPVDVSDEEEKIEGNKFELYLWADENDTFYCTINSYGIQYPFVALFDDYELTHLMKDNSFQTLFELKERELTQRTFVTADHRGFCYLCGEELIDPDFDYLDEGNRYLSAHDGCKEQLDELLSNLLEKYGEDIMIRKL